MGEDILGDMLRHLGVKHHGSAISNSSEWSEEQNMSKVLTVGGSR